MTVGEMSDEDLQAAIAEWAERKRKRQLADLYLVHDAIVPQAKHAHDELKNARKVLLAHVKAGMPVKGTREMKDAIKAIEKAMGVIFPTLNNLSKKLDKPA